MVQQTGLSQSGPSEPRKPSSIRYVLWVVGILAAIALCTCVILVAASVGLLAYLGGSPEGLSASYELPYSAHVGDEFELVLYLQNSRAEPIQVGDIDLDEAFGGSILDGATVLSTEPPMERDFSISGIKTYKFNSTIDAGETTVVRFRLRATTPGEFGGSVGIYVGQQAARVNPVITILD